MPKEKVTLATKDGHFPVFVLTPENRNSGPAIIFYMDAGGIRPAVLEMAQRLADAGYVVLVPDLFYRHGPYGPLVPSEVFAGDVAAILGPLMATTSNTIAAEDTGAVISYLETHPDVQDTKIGTVGFCMGGGMAIAAGGTYPDCVAAVASFHGGDLATDATDSPHLYASKLNAQLYVAVATDDPHCSRDMLKQFDQALDETNVPHKVEVYPAAHGWMKPDFPVHDEVAAERGWREMITFFDRTLKGL